LLLVSIKDLARLSPARFAPRLVSAEILPSFVLNP